MFYIQKYYRKGLVILILILVIMTLVFLNQKQKVLKEESIIKINETEIENNIINPKINIKGAVINPGVYEFKEGERVIDAINKSGGLLENADTSVINLSKNLFDEMVIIVYTYDEVNAMKSNNVIIQYVETECNCPKITNDACLIENDVNSSDNNVNNIKIDNNKISINTSTLEELQTLPGIGKTKAESIIKYREQNGKFSKIEDILNVSGIGESIFEKIKDNITI